MSMFSWLVLAAIIDEYKGLFLGLLIGIPLCFVHPILGILAGVGTALAVNRCSGD